MSAPVRLPEGTTLAVALRWDDGNELSVGRLALYRRRVVFEYDAAFVRGGLDVSPLRLPRQTGVWQARDDLFEGLPGIFNDSLPDGWGRLLLDRHARREGIAPETLTPLDRLAHVGCDGVGALVYRPELTETATGEVVNLDEIADESRTVLEEGSDATFDRLRRLGGSPQGARPKVLVQLHDATNMVTDARSDRGPGWRHWLVKFPARDDPPDIGPMEFAYALMAEAAGVFMPPTRLMPSGHGPGYFAAARFDRDGSRRRHVATASGLLDADFRLPSLDYEDLARLAVRLCRDHRQGEALFRQAVFNVMAHNRDDHAKQFSFLMDSGGDWQLAPAYDLTFANGPGGEHTTSVAGEGKAPGREQLLRVARAAGLKNAAADRVMAQTREAVKRWRTFAERAGVSARTTAAVAAMILE